MATKATRKAAMRKALKASPRAEARYVTDLRKILQGIHEWTEGQVKPLIDSFEPHDHELVRHDAPSKSALLAGVRKATDTVIAGIKVHVARHVDAAFTRMSDEVNKRNLAGMKLIGITPKSIGAEAVLKRARDANIKLVEDAGRSYAMDVWKVFSNETNFGVDVDDLKGQLWDLMKERGDVSESRASLIAVDQTLKLNSALTEDRHKSVGIDRYEWSTSGDERVREMHAELDGHQFSYDDPPVTNEEGDTNNPGFDYRCRCLAIGLLSDEENAAIDDDG